jgi:alcohol dehydrogenase class IV
MMHDFVFSRTPEIYFGQGKFRLLPLLIKRYGKNALVVTGARSFSESDNYSELVGLFKENSIHHFLIRISGEPSPLLIDSVVNEYLLKDIDVVVAIGGGSVLDSGKAISAMMGQDGFVQEFLEGVGTGRTHSGRRTPFIAVPTTAGTGSETTRNAVLSSVGKGGFKRSIRHHSFIPDIALVDPLLTLSCPADVTASCGMDALTQLLESYVSTNATPVTDSLCISGLSAIASGLQEAVLHPDNVHARGEMSYASMISGITLANAGLGIVHGFASVIGGYFNIPHGVVCGTLMGAVTRANISQLQKADHNPTALGKYAQAGRILLHKPAMSDQLACGELTNRIESWIEKFRIPKLGQYGMQSADLEKIVAETDQKQNPVKLSDMALINILKARI